MDYDELLKAFNEQQVIEGDADLQTNDVNNPHFQYWLSIRPDDDLAYCKYCEGDCPSDENNACDGYLGDIDNLYNVA